MVEAALLISFLQPSHGLRNSAPCHGKCSPRTSNITYHGAGNAKSQAPPQTRWIRICIFWRKSGAIDEPGNCFLSDACQNTSSAYCSDLAGQERLVSCVLVGWWSDWTPSCRENMYCLGDRVTWEHQEFEQQLRTSAKAFCSISWFPGWHCWVIYALNSPATHTHQENPYSSFRNTWLVILILMEISVCSRSGAGKPHLVVQIQPTDYFLVNTMLLKPSHTHSPVMPMAAFVLLPKSEQLGQTLWPTKPKTSTIWPFSEKVCQSVLWPKGEGSGVYVFQSMAFCLV